MEKILEEIKEIDNDAYSFIMSLFNSFFVWDDLKDKDKKISDIDIDRCFYELLINIPRNRFYAKYFNEINPLIISSINNWQIANNIEKKYKKLITGEYGDDAPFQKNDMIISFIIRSSYADIVTMVSYILCGKDFAERIGEKFRLFVHDEGFSAYIDSLKEEAKFMEA